MKSQLKYTCTIIMWFVKFVHYVSASSILCWFSDVFNWLMYNIIQNCSLIIFVHKVLSVVLLFSRMNLNAKVFKFQMQFVKILLSPFQNRQGLSKFTRSETDLAGIHGNETWTRNDTFSTCFYFTSIMDL